MARLFHQLQPHVRDGPLVREFIESIETLPGLDDWTLSEPVVARVPAVLAWGHALWMTRSIAGVADVHNAIGSQIASQGQPSAESLAELGGAGLCVGLGAIAAGRIPTGTDRTADWRMVWPDADEVDVEVTCAKRKDKHVARQKLAEALVSELFDAHRSVDVVIHLLDPTDRGNCEAVRDAVRTISSGETKHEMGRWEVRADPIEREPTVLFTASQDSAPPWWPVQHARSCVFRQTVATRDAMVAPPQMRMWFGLPYHAYVNPVMRKADAPQSTGSVPFLVAVDVADLPGAFSEIPRVVAGFLAQWPAVSGILIFQSVAQFNRVGWSWHLVSNPHARAQLPRSLRDGRADLPHTMDSYVKIDAT